MGTPQEHGISGEGRTSGDPDSGHAGKVELRGCQMDWKWDVRGRGGVTRTPELLAGAVGSWDCPHGHWEGHGKDGGENSVLFCFLFF